MGDAMTIKELADAFGMTTEQIFKNAHDRFGLLYSIGGPQITHARYQQFGYIPIYVARYAKEMERLLVEHHKTLN